jgi:hypothetical protein
MDANAQCAVDHRWSERPFSGMILGSTSGWSKKVQSVATTRWIRQQVRTVKA